MYCPAELVLKSYKPLHLEKGMLFITKLNPGTRKEYVELWELKELPVNVEEFYLKNGYPVELQVIYDDELIADHHEIGWFDEGAHTDDLRDITLKEINTILYDYDGEVDIEIEDELLENEDKMKAVLREGKAVLSFPFAYEEEDEDEDFPLNLEVWTNGKHLGKEMIELDGDSHLSHCVLYEDRLFAITTNLQNEVKWPYSEALLHPDDDSEMDVEEEEEDDDDPICFLCKGSGEGSYDGSTCSSCGGSGVDKRRDEDPDGDWDDMDDDS